MGTHRGGVEEVSAQFRVTVRQQRNIFSQAHFQRGVTIDGHFFETESELMAKRFQALPHLFAQMAAGPTVERQ